MPNREGFRSILCFLSIDSVCRGDENDENANNDRQEMNKRLNALIVAGLCLLMLPVVTFAQLPTPTYGTNLGNTLEPPCGEGCWGPAATQALINAIADAGFNTVRIPCAWDSHANQTTYVIDPAYMARVKQVVDWCYARNLYVIINCHWDGGWLENNITGTVNPTINAKQNSYWTQIANTFVNYDDHLLFAGCNEPGADTAAEMSTLLVYEQTFVNAVRATGGSNSTRWLLVQGPNTDIDLTYSLMNTLPTDSATGRLMVEVHYYSPYQYTLMESDQGWGNQFFYWGQGYHSATDTAHNPTWGEESYMAAQFQKMTAKFVNHGVPVLIGEFSAKKRTSQLSGADLDLHLRARTYFHKTVVDYANSHGLRPCYWDITGAGNFNWTTGAEVDPHNINALTGGAALPPSGGLYADCAEVQAAGHGYLSDLDGDCYVNYFDIETIALYWLHSDCEAPDNCEGADFAPADGVVDLRDFSDFASQWLWCNDPENYGCMQNW